MIETWDGLCHLALNWPVHLAVEDESEAEGATIGPDLPISEDKRGNPRLSVEMIAVALRLEVGVFGCQLSLTTGS